MAASSREPVWSEPSQGGTSSTSMVDGYGQPTSFSPPSASAEQQRSLQRFAAPGALAQLTAQEARALENVKKTATNAKNVGYGAGLAVAIYFARRRKPPLNPLATGGLALMGMFVGGVSAVPVGIFMGRKYLQDVEDPKHLATVLQGAIEERRSGGVPPPNAVSGPPGRSGNFGGQSGQQGPRQTPPAQSGFPGDAPFPGMSSGSGSSGTSPYNGGSGGFYNGPSVSDAPPPFESTSYGSGWSDQQQQQGQEQQGQGQGSRWAQLRGETVKAQSSWDKLRGPAGAAQVRGAEANSGDGYGSPGSSNGGYAYAAGSRNIGDGSSASGPGSSSFMADIGAEREKARREYEASFERERRGID